MDKHYLTPLFQPESIAVFAGGQDATRQTPQAQALVAALTAQRYQGQLVFVDTHLTGTSMGRSKVQGTSPLRIYGARSTGRPSSCSNSKSVRPWPRNAQTLSLS